MQLKKTRMVFFPFLVLSFLAFTFSAAGQIQSKNKNVSKMLCFLDGEIIFDPDTSFTVQALTKIEVKTLASTQIIVPKTALKLYGKRGRTGVFLMYSKKDAESVEKNQAILRRYQKTYFEDKFQSFKKDFPQDSLMDASHPEKEDIFPQFPGGRAALNQFIAATVQYPETALQNQIMGKVEIGFMVGEDGVLSDFKVIRGNDLGGGLTEEALLVAKKFPRFYPGSRKQKAIKVFYSVPINFVIAK